MPCRKRFAETTGTGVSRLRPPPETVTLGRTLLAHGGPLPAMGVACGCAERTGADWGARTGLQGQAGQEPLVEQPQERGQGHAEARRVKQQGGVVWRALAGMGPPRLWLAGEGSEPRAMPLSRRLRARVSACAVPRARLGWPDGC